MCVLITFSRQNRNTLRDMSKKMFPLSPYGVCIFKTYPHVTVWTDGIYLQSIKNMADGQPNKFDINWLAYFTYLKLLYIKKIIKEVAHSFLFMLYHQKVLLNQQKKRSLQCKNYCIFIVSILCEMQCLVSELFDRNIRTSFI